MVFVKASSSSFSLPRNSNKDDVFLRFRAQDTRENSTSHLYSALCQKNIETFIDDQLIRGDEISVSSGWNLRHPQFQSSFSRKGMLLPNVVSLDF